MNSCVWHFVKTRLKAFWGHCLRKKNHASLDLQFFQLWYLDLCDCFRAEFLCLLIVVGYSMYFSPTGCWIHPLGGKFNDPSKEFLKRHAKIKLTKITHTTNLKMTSFHNSSFQKVLRTAVRFRFSVKKKRILTPVTKVVHHMFGKCKESTFKESQTIENQL